MEPVTPRVLLSVTHRGAGADSDYEQMLGELTQRLANALTRAGADVERLDAGLGYVPKLENIDGLLLFGDADIDPAKYATDWTQEQENRRRRNLKHLNAEADSVEISLVKEALETKTAIFGIGRGMQIINVALGGTLLPAEEIPYCGSVSAAGIRPNVIQGRAYRELVTDGERVYASGHTLLGELDQIRTIPGTTLAAALECGGGAVGVISNARMAVKTVAPGLRVSATTTDGQVEGVERDRTAFDVPLVAKAGWVLGVHWHPEEPRTPTGQLEALVDSFLAAARIKARRRKQ